MSDDASTCPACGDPRPARGRVGEVAACPSCGHVPEQPAGEPKAESEFVAEVEVEKPAARAGGARGNGARKRRSKVPAWIWGVVTVLVGLGGAVVWFGLLRNAGPAPDPGAPATGAVAAPGGRPGGWVAPPSPFALDSEPRKMAAPPGPIPPEVADTVLLLAADHPVPSIFMPNLLDQELARQALGVAAREEFGLRVRDGALGDAAPDGLPTGRQFRLRQIPNHMQGWEVLVGPPGSEHQFWSGPLLGGQFYSAPEKYLAEHERLATGFFAKCLTGAGLAARPARRSDASVPAEAEEALGRMRETDQFAAVRRLHDEVRARGESDALVAGLVRGYANLALLTEFHWGAPTYVYRARGLLYAQRLVARAPNSAAALRLRAYAAALAGWHALAVKDFDAAQKLPPAGPVPAWVAAAEHYVRFDVTALRAARAKSDSPLLRVLEFLAVEGPAVATIRAGRALLEVEPECYLVHDALCRTGGVSHLHRATVAGPEVFAGALADRVRGVPGVPDSVRRAADGPAPEPGVYAALRAAGRTDPGEPSWAALGGLLQDVRFAQAAHRLGFLAGPLAADPREEAREFAAALAGHRLGAFVESYAFDHRLQPAEVRRRLEAVPVGEADVRATTYFTRLGKVDPAAARDRWALGHAGLYRQESDRVYLLRYDATGAARAYVPQLLMASPHAPIGRALSIAHNDPPQPPATLAEAEARYAGSADVQWGLGYRHRAEGRLADAARCWERQIALSPDGRAFRELSALYRTAGDLKKWQETLEASLKEEDTGLHHARARVDLAEHFMRLKDFRRAEPYATAAAASGAAWAIQCAAECQEGLGEWGAANDLYAANAARYPEMTFAWYFACRQTGKMDRAAAERAVRGYLAAYGPGETPGLQSHAARFYLLTGDMPKARALFDRFTAVEPSALSLAFVALLADAAGDAPARSRALDQFDKLPVGQNAVRPVGAALRSWSAAGDTPDDAAVEAGLKRLAPEHRPDGEFLYGWYLHNRKESTRAKALWERCLAAEAGASWVKTHARAFAEAVAPKRD